jgi:hypothetical protein
VTRSTRRQHSTGHRRPHGRRELRLQQPHAVALRAHAPQRDDPRQHQWNTSRRFARQRRGRGPLRRRTSCTSSRSRRSRPGSASTGERFIVGRRRAFSPRDGRSGPAAWAGCRASWTRGSALARAPSLLGRPPRSIRPGTRPREEARAAARGGDAATQRGGRGGAGDEGTDAARPARGHPHASGDAAIQAGRPGPGLRRGPCAT